jgi:hypothetical protein
MLAESGWKPADMSAAGTRSLGMAEDIAKHGIVEVEDCSGTGFGFCLYQYEGPAGSLVVTTAGQIEADGTMPTVVSYSVACSPANAAAQEPIVNGRAPFTVSLTFSEAAAAKIAETNERVTISTKYYAEPAPGVELEEPGMAGIDLGNEEREVEGVDGTVGFDGAYDAAATTRAAGPPRLSINVFTARKTQARNLLSCGHHDGELAAAAQGVAIACKLIRE